MKKLNQVQAACLQAAALLACSAALSTAQAQSGSQATSTAEVPEIIVTASRSEQLLQTAPVGATIITRAQIESAGVVDANEAIRKIGGVAGKGDLFGGREYTLDIRGFGNTSNENTVVLIDGIRISENELGVPARLSAISANSIEQIEIMRGGSSVMWGEGATSGVINIITRKDIKAGISGQIGITAETYGGKDGSAIFRVGSSTGKSVFDINARSSSSKGYRENNQFSQDVMSIGLSATEGALNFRTRVNHEIFNSGLPGSLTLVQVQANPRQSLTLDDKYSIRQTRLNTGVDYNFGAWTAIVDMGIKQRTVSSLYVSFGATVPSITTTNATQFSPRAVYKGSLGTTALTTNIGLDINHWQYTSNVFTPSRAGEQTNRAIFAMTDWLLPSLTRIVAGYRVEGVTKTELDSGAAATTQGPNNKLTATELSVNQTVDKGFDLYGRFSKSYRLANIDEYKYTNPVSLLPQTSNDKEVGLKIKRVGSTFTTRYFLQNTINEIAPDPTTSRNINIDPTKRSGFELQASMDVSSVFSISGNFQSIKAVFSGGADSGKTIPLVNQQTATARLIYKLDQNQGVEVAARTLSSAYYGGDSSNSCSKKIPSNRMFDALYRFKTKTYEAAIGVNNLTNTLSYTGFNCGLAWEGVYPEAGRTFKATLKYNF
jgi:iron complex outermembrane recepter protein